VPVTHGVAGSNPVSTARKPSSYKASEKSGAFFSQPGAKATGLDNQQSQ
jgi:hypothetical protein